MTEPAQEELNQIRQRALDALHMVREGKNEELPAEFRLYHADSIDDVTSASEEDLQKYADIYSWLSTWRLVPNGARLRFPLRVAIVLGKKMTKEDFISAMSTGQLFVQPQERNVEADGARLFFQRGQKEFSNERFSIAASYFRRAVKIWPQYREAWYALGGTCELLGLIAEADEAFTKAGECS